MKFIAWVIVFLLLLVGSAESAPFTPEMNVAYRISNSHWGGHPPNCLSVDKQIVPNEWIEKNYGDPSDDDILVGWATIPGEVPTHCRLFIDRYLADPYEFVEMCSVVSHEGGHLWGNEHVDDPSDLMFHDPPKTAECRRAGKLLIRSLVIRERLKSEAHWIPQNRKNALRAEMKEARKKFFKSGLK